MSATEIRRLKAEAAEMETTLRDENKKLREAKGELADRVADLASELKRLELPQVIPVSIDKKALENQYLAFVAHWGSLPMDLRERFFAEHKAPFAARSNPDEIPDFLNRAYVPL